MKAVIYLRISSDKQVLNTSLETQELACRNYCKQEGFEIMDIVRDEAISANKNNIQRVAELLNYCDENKNKFDTLVVFKLDRFARSQEHHHYLRSKLKKININLRSATENIGEQGSPKLIEGILAAVNEYDNDIRTERSKLGMVKRLDEGLWPWNPPVGYYLPKIEGVKLSLAIHDTNCSGGVSQIFTSFSTSQFTYKALADQFNQGKYLNYQGKLIKLYPQGIKKILENPFYVGLTKNTLDHQIRQGKHEPLVTQEIWNRCQQIIKGKPVKTVRKKINPSFPLRGLVIGPCNHPLTAAFSRGRHGEQYGYYFCLKRDSANYSDELIHDKFLDLLSKIEPPKPTVDVFFELFKETVVRELETNKTQENHYQDKMMEIKKKQSVLLDMRLNGEIDKETFLSKQNSLSQELNNLKPNIIPSREKIDVDELVRFGKSFVTDVRERWEKLELQDKLLYQGSIFPEKLQWDGFNYRTPILHEVFGAIFSLNSNNVTPQGIEP